MKEKTKTFTQIIKDMVDNTDDLVEKETLRKGLEYYNEGITFMANHGHMGLSLKKGNSTDYGVMISLWNHATKYRINSKAVEDWEKFLRPRSEFFNKEGKRI